ncbi:MAG: hypothetical protein JWM40_1699, partial [Frankiales bacterium]|nr:hypothetical protein [Frankiales bacterium]
ALQQDHRSTAAPSHHGSVDPPFSLDPALAPPAWSTSLVPAQTGSRWFVTLGNRQVSSGPLGTALVGGHFDQVTVVTGGWITTASDAQGRATTSFHSEHQADGGPAVWSVSGTTAGHAVNPAGTEVAVSVGGRPEVVTIATGAVGSAAPFFRDAGVPAGWVGDDVYFNAADGSLQTWHPSLGTGSTQSATTLLDTAHGIFATRAGGGCIQVAPGLAAAKSFSQCRYGTVRVAPYSDDVLFVGGGRAEVVSATTGEPEHVGLPDTGVLAAGWDNVAVVAVVRGYNQAYDAKAYVVRCVIDSDVCQTLTTVSGDDTRALVARYIESGRD